MKKYGLYILLGVGAVIGVGYTLMSCAWGDCWWKELTRKKDTAETTKTQPVSFKN